MACPAHNQCSPPPPQPPQSDRHPPPPGPLLRKSYANTVCDVTALVNLAKTMPDLPSDHILAMHKASLLLPSNKCWINSMTSGPSWHQVLIQLDTLPSGSKLPVIVSSANRALARSDLRVDSCYTAYGGLTLLTNCVASQSEIDLIGGAVTQSLALPMPAVAALPTSPSYLKIVNVPYFIGTNTPLTSPFIKEAMGKSHLASLFTLANSPQVMWNSRKSDTATVWFNILNFQLDATAKRLVGSSFQFGSLLCFIHMAKAHPGTLLCQRCWHWGYSTKACCLQALHCLQCSSPHNKANHCSLASCCRGNPLANPSQPTTPEGAPCPHTAHCVNCEGKHSAANQ
jgi:hypothetical protein